MTARDCRKSPKAGHRPREDRASSCPVANSGWIRLISGQNQQFEPTHTMVSYFHP